MIQLHQYAFKILQDLHSKRELKLNEDLLTKLCLDEIEAMDLKENYKKVLQTKFKSWKLREALVKACQIVKIYQKGIEIDKIDDINRRIGIILKK